MAVGIRLTEYWIDEDGNLCDVEVHETKDCINVSPFVVDLGDISVKVEFFEHKDD